MTKLKSAVSSRRRGWFLPPFPPFPEHHWYRSASRKFSILCSFRKRRSIVRALTTTGTVAKTSACPAEIHPFSRVEFIWKGYSLILTLNQRLRCSCLVPCVYSASDLTRHGLFRELMVAARLTVNTIILWVTEVVSCGVAVQRYLLPDTLTKRCSLWLRVQTVLR